MNVTHRLILGSLATCVVATTAGFAHAQETVATPPPQEAKPSYPSLGGHLGLALPIATIAKDSTAIGADFVSIGITPGITVNLSEHWAIDFEFIAFNEVKNTPAATTLVVDPGVLYKLKPVVLGLRVAAQVGAPTNAGLVPIFVLPFKISKELSYFVEADLPFFLRDDGKKIQPSLTFLFQTGFGF